ncbi:hypothetical protein GGH95_003291, partial [Coemansia sp. RSA 1836]
MPTLSPFQILPLHVVQIIVEHVVGSSRLQFAGVHGDSSEYMALLRPLLWVCHNFRAVAYPRYCTRFYLDPTSSAPWGQWPNPFGLGYHTHQLAKDLCIELSERSIYSGKALDTLSQAPYEGHSFPLVRVLTIFIIVDDTNEAIEPDSSAVEINIGALVQRIKEMAPMLSKVCVEVDNNEELLEITR